MICKVCRIELNAYNMKGHKGNQSICGKCYLEKKRRQREKNGQA